MRDKQAQGATLTVVLQKAKGLQRVNGLLEGPRPDVFVTVEVENEELFTSPLRCDLGVPLCIRLVSIARCRGWFRTASSDRAGTRP